MRVVECRIATKLLAKLNGLDWESVSTLHQLQTEKLKLELDCFEHLIKKTLTKDIYDKDELIAIFQLNQHEFEEKFLTPNTKKYKQFKLRPRALHVVSGEYLFIILSLFKRY